MDNTEYTIKKDEIRSLIDQKEYAQAAEIADTIDWRRVRSVMMLCTISDLYKINRRYEDAKNMLLLAYEYRPGGRSICYSLCELCTKMEEFVEAVRYYKEFVQAAPKDPDRYVLQYKLYEAQDVSLEERIEVLKELKQKEYREKWAYELAYLYHRIGQATLCVEECDELILWFGNGKYVYKAMELKMLHQPLSPSQQDKYDHRLDGIRVKENVSRPSQNVVYPQPREQRQNYERTRKQEQMPTRGYERAAAYEQEQVYGQERSQAPSGAYDPAPNYELVQEEDLQQSSPEPEAAERIARVKSAHRGQDFEDTQTLVSAEAEQGNSDKMLESEIQVPIMDMGQYNTMNLQAEIAAGLQEVLEREDGTHPDEIMRTIIAPMLESDTGRLDGLDAEELDDDEIEIDTGEVEETEVFFGETGEINSVQFEGRKEIVPEMEKGRAPERKPETVPEIASEVEAEGISDVDGDTKVFEIVRSKKDVKTQAGGQNRAVADVNAGAHRETSERAEVSDMAQAEKLPDLKHLADETADLVMRQMRMENKAEAQVMVVQPPRELANVLSQESDGQISLVMPETEAVEKQITGQMSIEDILAEWERIKQENVARRKAELQQRVLQQTGDMFTEFEAAVRDGLLEKLESEVDREQEEIPKPEEGLEQSQAEEFVTSGVPEDLGEIEDLEEIQEAYEAAGVEAALEQQRAEQFGMETAGEPEAVEESEAQTEPEAVEEPEVQPEPESTAEFETSMKPEGMEEAEPVPEPQAETKMAQQPEAVEEPEAQPEPEGAAEFETSMEPEGMKEAEPAPEPQSETKMAQQPEAVEEPEVQPEPESTAEFETSMEPEGMEEAEPVPEPQSETKMAQQPEAVEEPEVQPEPESAAESDLWTEPEASADTENAHQLSEDEERPPVRKLTREERELYAPYIQSRSAREQLVKAIDSISMAAYTGNIVITGEEGMNTITLAKNMIREVQMTDRNFLGKVAKISGQGLNQRNVKETLEQLQNGSLIIQKASGMQPQTVTELARFLKQENKGIIIVIEDTKKAIAKLFAENPRLGESFTARMDVETLSNDTLASFGIKYARQLEFSMDDMGVLALHKKIEELQTIDHVVTVVEVKNIVDSAIRHAKKKTLGHFMDILLAKRYDDEDMIVLTEKDFV